MRYVVVNLIDNHGWEPDELEMRAVSGMDDIIDYVGLDYMDPDSFEEDIEELREFIKGDEKQKTFYPFYGERMYAVLKLSD